MTSLPHIQYFLGANAPTGFYSLYSELIPTQSANCVYILKGGPGCGKSTLMRKVAAQMEKLGEEVEYILCSGDPESLDAIVLPSKKVAIVDGTAPHVVEPKLPAVVERYVNLGECYDTQSLAAHKQAVAECFQRYKACYQRAYRCLAAYDEVFSDIRATLVTDALCTRLAKRAWGILSRELKPKKDGEIGTVTQRFLGAVTNQGPMCLFDTALAQCPRIYELADNYGLAHELLVHLLAGAVEGGYHVIACPDPMSPDRLAHLLIPEVGLAFLTATNALPLPKHPYRRLRLDAAAGADLIRRNRPRLRFSKKISGALMDEAIASLLQAKLFHDELEGIYNPYVNFEQVEEVSQRIIGEILSIS